MPPHRRYLRQLIRRLWLALSLALARFPPHDSSRKLSVLRDEWWGAGRVEREIRLRCFFSGVWLADAVSLFTTGEARHLILRKEMRIKNETEAN